MLFSFSCFYFFFKILNHYRFYNYISVLISSLIFFSYIYTYTLFVYFNFDHDYLGYQLICYFTKLNIYFAIDNLALLFLLLSSFIFPICIILHYSHNYKASYDYRQCFKNIIRSRFQSSIIFFLSILLLNIILLLYFTTLNFFLFFLTFEGSVIPLFLMIGVFGSRVENRIKASMYIYFFTVVSSLSFLFALFFIYFSVGSLNLLFLMFTLYTVDVQKFLWLCFFIPIASKVPIMPFHIWLPEAHVEAPTEGSVLLASLMLKLGAYFLLRFLLPLFPFGTKYFIPLAYSLFAVSLVYTSCLIFNQMDLKKIIAYSSISHMNLALIGLFSGTLQGIQGSIYMFFTHGIISSGLFICIGWLYSRYFTRTVTSYQGLHNSLPILSLFFFVFILGNLSFPGTGSFISELLIIIGVVQKSIFLTLICLISSFLCTLYSIYIYTRIFFGVSHKTFYQYNYSCSEVVNQKSIDHYYLKNNYILIDNVLKSEYYVLLFLALYTIISGIIPNIYLNFIRMNSYYLFIILN